ncbi:MAG TPA: enolase C-terminal domain-like protein, partial [Planctomycetota bacterium]|nr:enolase C-terminal domain-like protein [Planctomycetota bacterium]
ERVETKIVEHALRRDRMIVSHAGAHDRSRYLTVIAESSDGIRGYGEAATTPLWSGEAAETAQWMVEHVFAPRVCRKTFDHPREALALMDAAAFANPFAKGAVDAAIWDVFARMAGVPAAKLFGDREPVKSIPTRASVGAYSVKETVRLAVEFWNAGIRTLKFKVGVKGISDAERLKAVRERLGNEPIFTVDANGAWQSSDEALVAIESMLPYKLALVEQPTPRDRIDLLAEVHKRIKVPLMADEAVFTPDHLQAALDCDAFDILSVYPGKNGGVTRSVEMTLTAQKAGKTCAIGSNLETELGQGAMLAVAAGLSAFPIRELACDLSAAIFYERSSLKEPLVFKNGEVAVPARPGFGVEPL